MSASLALQHQASSLDAQKSQTQQHTFLLSSGQAFSAGSASFQWGSSDRASNQASANFSTRATILQYIVENPGVYLRETAEFLLLPVAVVEYHVSVLEKSGQVEDFQNGRYKRFFAAGVYGDMQKKVISQMRQDTPSKILAALASNASAGNSHTQLAKSLGITSQALTWQIGRLKALGLVRSSFEHGNGGLLYYLNSEAIDLVQQFKIDL